jgi:hypothetical protein
VAFTRMCFRNHLLHTSTGLCSWPMASTLAEQSRTSKRSSSSSRPMARRRHALLTIHYRTCRPWSGLIAVTPLPSLFLAPVAFHSSKYLLTYGVDVSQCSSSNRSADPCEVFMLKVGVTGFCQGGALTCLSAEYADVTCGVAFYGYPKSYPSKV